MKILERMQHDTQPIDDLVHLPHLNLDFNIHSYGVRFLEIVRRRWFKSKKWLRVPGLLRTPYSHSRIILFVEGTAYSDQRVINISPHHNPDETIFPNNRSVTKKYTLWNFIPKNLFEQFRRVANFYFLIMTIIALMIESPISPLTSILPLSFVILVTACKQGYEDYLRHVMDQRVNRTLVTVIRNKCVQSIPCEQIVVGDLVKVHRDQDIPSDLLLLFSTEESDRCYITTSNLDGETNLKTVMVPKVLSRMTMSEIVSMEAEVMCQHPSSDLYSFHGKFEILNTDGIATAHLTANNLLLRGSRLKDTDHIVGCAIYTGQDTKLSLNSKIRCNKFSTAEKSINRHILIFVALLIAEVIESYIMKVVTDKSAKWEWYIGPSESVTFNSMINDLLSFTVLYNFIIPISLYVTIELQKFLSSFFFSWDADMYDNITDQPALANTSDLNEELGQIEYLFVDKTGTLTENLMVFKRCSVNGKVYMEKDCSGKLYLLPPSGNEAKAVLLRTWEPALWHFMISISLCHNVQISPPSQRHTVVARRIQFRESFRLKKILQMDSSLLMDPDLPEYQAASADEKALVEASARCGVIFQRSTSDAIELKIEGNVLTYEKCDILEFTSERKRMSVIVKDSTGTLWLYCKGADSSVFPLITGRIDDAIAHVADFSMRGLRTLVVAYKTMTQTEYNRLMQRVAAAREIIGLERGVLMERAYSLMEDGLTLLGVTGVEDRLQEGVQETLECLQLAGIKIWVLSGDKAETAENIAFLCGQFKSGTEVLKMTDISSELVCFHKLTDFQRRINLEPHKQYGFLVDGCTITTALRSNEDEFRAVGMSCDAVVCCRLTPLQKSEIVNLLKRANSRPHTAAIGDGGNDVAMIQEAHVGIGIMGKEGRQATMSSDFAIAKFKFLRKALLVHGHWYYVRISTLTQYFFYKNLILTTPQFIFSIYCGYSAQAFYDALFLMLYNVLFTSLPILVYGLFEQDYTADVLLRYPYLYKMYQRNYLLSSKEFIVWSSLACWHALVIYFTTHMYIHINPVTLYNNTPMDQWSFSTCIFHLVTWVANLQVLLRTSYWSVPLVLTVVLSQLSFLIIASSYSFVHTRYDGNMLGVFHVLISSLSFWLLTIIIIVACLIPDYLIIMYNRHRHTRVIRRNEEPRHEEPRQEETRQEETRQEIGNNNTDPGTVPLETWYQRYFNAIPWRYSFTLQKAEQRQDHV